MRADLGNTFSFSHIFRQEFIDKVSSLVIFYFGQLDVFCHLDNNHIYDVFEILQTAHSEGSFAGNQLESQNANGPQVNSLVVESSRNQLRRKVQRSTTKGLPQLFIGVIYTPSKVSNFDNITRRNQNILRFNISMDNKMSVKILNGSTYLSDQLFYLFYFLFFITSKFLH